ncbi:DUF6243 family protein [Streptomyces sp. NPDC058637]|uniref:DUF6243 family protein n=1 Tax=Streptomyces sp. NPDC058637 TaxID=3346569 RepID=UPI003660584A
MAKSRNNLLGVGGQRKKPSRAEQQGAGPARDADRRTAAEQKQELVRKMRERAEGSGSAQVDASSDASSSDSSEQNGTAAQS